MTMCFGNYDNEDDGKDHYSIKDMEIRDHLAGLALQGMINAPDWFSNAGHWKDEKTMFKTYAKEAYKFADAMIKERDK